MPHLDKLLTELKILRKNHTYHQMAQLLGVSDHQVWRWVNGKTHISPAWRIILEDQFGIKKEDKIVLTELERSTTNGPIHRHHPSY